VTQPEEQPAWSLARFSWNQLLLLLATGVVACTVGTFFSYNGPLSSPAWQDWVNQQCSSRPGAHDGTTYGPVIDVIRAVLAAGLTVFAFYRLSIIPTGRAPTKQRPLNWIPVLRAADAERLGGEPDLQFEAGFGFEKWLLAGFLVLAVLVITIDRPLEFLGEIGHATASSLFGNVGLLYSADFAGVTKTYLFPYSLYIMGLWYFMALPVLLALIRRIRYDMFDYAQLSAALVVPEGVQAAGLAHNAVGLYERKCFACFGFTTDIGKRYALFLIGVVLLCYFEQVRLQCSVLAGATDTGKLLLLLLSVSSFAAVIYTYLRLHYEVRVKAQLGVTTLSDALERDETRAQELRDATDLAEKIRQKEGLAEFSSIVGGGGLVGIIAVLFWKIVLHGDLCTTAYAIFPNALVQQIAKVFQLQCPLPPH
jgi:hypothetical protein